MTTWDDETEDVDGDGDGDELDGDDETDGVDGAYPVPGTIRRPLLGPRGKARWDPTIRWGDRVLITLGRSTGVLPLQSADLLNTRLKKPATCQIQFHAELVNPLEPSLVAYTQVELHIGNGSQLTVVRRRFNFLPQAQRLVTLFPANEPLNVTVDASWTLPMTNIRGRVAVQGASDPDPAPFAQVACSLWLTPLVNS